MQIEVTRIDPEGSFEESLAYAAACRVQSVINLILKAEVDTCLRESRHLKDALGRQRLVRNGYCPTRFLQSELGEIRIRAPRIRDRAQLFNFQSKIMSPYVRSLGGTQSAILWSYLNGLLAHDFSALIRILTGDPACWSALESIQGLPRIWHTESNLVLNRDLSGLTFNCLWGGILTQQSDFEAEPLPMLILLGKTQHSAWEILAVSLGAKDAESKWYQLLRKVFDRGLTHPPRAILAEVNSAFWEAFVKAFLTDDSTSMVSGASKTTSEEDFDPSKGERLDLESSNSDGEYKLGGNAVTQTLWANHARLPS